MAARNTLLNTGDMQVLCVLARAKRTPLTVSVIVKALTEAGQDEGRSLDTRVRNILIKLDSLGFCRIQKNEGRTCRINATPTEAGNAIASAYTSAEEYWETLSRAEVRFFLETYAQFGHSPFCLSDTKKISDRQALNLMQGIIRAGLSETCHTRGMKAYFQFKIEAMVAYGLLSDRHLEPYIKQIAPLRAIIASVLLGEEGSISEGTLARKCNVERPAIRRALTAQRAPKILQVDTASRPYRYFIDREAAAGDSELHSLFVEYDLENPFTP